MVAAAVVGSAVVGAVGSSVASGQQADAANNAADQQQQASQDAQNRLQPYASTGQKAINPLIQAMGYELDPTTGQMYANPNSTLQQKFNFNANDLANSPGYQFNMQQGLRGVTNSAASQGLGLSGAQLKGATSFASGLADNTYGQQYNRALSTYNTNYQTANNNVNNLQNMVNMGQNSAAGQGQAGITGAQNAGNYQVQAGNAQASGTMGIANAASNGVNNYLTYNALYPSASQQTQTQMAGSTGVVGTGNSWKDY